MVLGGFDKTRNKKCIQLKNLPANTPHLIVLFVCLTIIGFALILTPPTKEMPRVMLGPLPLPEVCTFHNLTDLPCPGCGLTRSIVAIVHGRIKSSFNYHCLGIITLFYMILQIGYRSSMVLLPVKNRLLIRSGKILNKGIIFLGFLFFINWIINLTSILFI